MKIEHHPDESTLVSYAAGALSEALSAVTASHVELCSNCRGRVSEQLGQAAINAEVATLLRRRATWRAAEGHALGAEGAMSKSFSAVNYLADSQAWMDLVGPYGLLERSQANSAGHGIFEETYRNSPVTTIYGGTVDVQRNIVTGLMGL